MIPQAGLLNAWHVTVWDRASVVVQWFRICVPMLGTWVQSLVQEDPTSSMATKPTRHSS